MGFRLSEEARQRIENEERSRIAEDHYRAEVRERLKAEPETAQTGSSGRKIVFIVIVLVIIYALIKSH